MSLEPLFVPDPRGASEIDGELLEQTFADNDPGSHIWVLDAGSPDECAAIREHLRDQDSAPAPIRLGRMQSEASAFQRAVINP
jgi:carotenoid cleavage dioxygenase-like enzyme